MQKKVLFLLLVVMAIFIFVSAAVSSTKFFFNAIGVKVRLETSSLTTLLLTTFVKGG